ncbi:hypothetical protein LEP1GSC170_5093 [Leptospira interrogans serovar Bataviae str. HAI135]|nr:hypothetical protein LEP1GSC170_5093 [Leptospira interrogans serovar Bataviae str. HAI135]
MSTISVSTQLTGTGQTILMILIQIGGLGLMTLTVFLRSFWRAKSASQINF